jgi:hypothetical protein
MESVIHPARYPKFPSPRFVGHALCHEGDGESCSDGPTPSKSMERGHTTKCCNGESCLEECMRVGFGSISPTGWRREEGERSRARMKVVVGLATPNSKKILLQVPSPSHSRKQVRLAGATHPPLCRTCISPTALRLSRPSLHQSLSRSPLQKRKRIFPVPPFKSIRRKKNYSWLVASCQAATIS